MDTTDVRVLSMSPLQPYMDKNFIQNLFTEMGENILKVDVIKKGRTRYGLVKFKNEYLALLAMHKWNKRIVPGTQPPVNFYLKQTSFKGKFEMSANNSVWIGNLSRDVEDYTLFEAFSSRYPSVGRAYVIRDKPGSKGYGFVYFAKEEEQRDALNNMQGYVGIGSNAITVSPRKYKNKGQNTNTTKPPYQPMGAVHATSGGQAQPSTSATTTQQNFSQYHEQYRYNYTAHETASPNYGNYYNPSNYSQYHEQHWYNYAAHEATSGSYGNYYNPRNHARNDYDQQQTMQSRQQPRVRIAPYLADAHPSPRGEPMARRRTARYDDDNEPDGNYGPVRRKWKYERR